MYIMKFLAIDFGAIFFATVLTFICTGHLKLFV